MVGVRDCRIRVRVSFYSGISFYQGFPSTVIGARLQPSEAA